MTIDAPAGINADFAMVVQDDGMVNDHIFAGDILFIQSQDTVENGALSVVLIDDAAELGRIWIGDGYTLLTRSNPLYASRFLDDDAHIMGKVVAVLRMLEEVRS